MPELTLKQGDTTPELRVTLENPAQEFDGSEMVRFYMEGPSDSNGPAGDLLVNAEIPDSNVEYQDPENPKVTYDFEKGDTSQIGTNKAEVVVTYADGEVQSFPDRGQFWNVQINEPTNREVPPAELDPPDIEVGVVNGDVVDARTLRAIETLSGALTGGATLDTLAGPNLSIEDGALVGIGDTQLTGEQVRTEIAAFLRASGASSIEYDDANDELTISSTDENTQRSDEEIEDVVGALLSASGSASVEYDDQAGTLTIGATDTDTQLAAEEVQNIVGSLIAGEGATSVNYDDQNGVLTVSSTDTNTNTQLSDEQVQDIVGGFIAGDGATSVNYDDSTGSLTISSTDTSTDTQLSEGEVRTIVEAYLAGGENVQLSASGGTLTIAADHDHAGEQLGTAENPVSEEYVDISNVSQSSIEKIATRIGLTNDEVLPANSSWTEIPFNDVQIDTLGASDGNRIIVPSDGTYAIAASAMIGGVAGEQLVSQVQINGETESLSIEQTSTTENVSVNINDVMELSTGDVLRVRALNGFDTDLTVVGNYRQTYLTVTRLG